MDGLSWKIRENPIQMEYYGILMDTMAMVIVIMILIILMTQRGIAGLFHGKSYLEMDDD